MIRTAFLLTAVLSLGSNAFADSGRVDAGEQKAAPPSKAVRLSDAQLDEITAGTATSIVLLSNGGSDQVIANRNHIMLLNGGAEGGATGIVIHLTPNKTFITCIGGPC